MYAIYKCNDSAAAFFVKHRKKKENKKLK